MDCKGSAFAGALGREADRRGGKPHGGFQGSALAFLAPTFANRGRGGSCVLADGRACLRVGSFVADRFDAADEPVPATLDIEDVLPVRQIDSAAIILFDIGATATSTLLLAPP